MPWGVDLIPVGSYGPATISDRNTARFLWAHSTEPNLSGNWAELWTTMLQNVQREDLPIPFEVLGVRGFQRESTTGSAAGGNLVVTYVDGPGVEPPDWLGNNEAVNGDVTTSPIRNMDRIRIATSLSRRFFYTGAPPATNSAAIKYTSKFNPLDTSVNACFENGRTVPVQEFRLGARGGWLKLDSYWTPFTGCGLTGWTHSASLGRDHQVNLRLAGWLFPFGVQAELVTISERAFVKDEAGHFVAPLIKQAFIQVPQPNRVDPGHSESVFRSVSVTTKRTPPLDPPPGPGGSVSSYNEYNFFLPIVDGLPFEFEHVGTDWAGETHASRMPMFFVSNEVTDANGLIWEPGYEPGFDWTPIRRPSDINPIPITGEGLRVLDQKWNAQPYRFANYGESLINIAKPVTNGDTSTRVEWVEWTRGSVWTIPRINGVAVRPFIPRTRTTKVKLQGMTQFSGENKFSLATYRDTRFTTYPILDPEPNARPEVYGGNVPPDPDNASSPYLFLLETRDLIRHTGPVTASTPEETRKRIRSIYFGTSVTPDPIPDSLFSLINNEIQFGTSASSDSTGGLSVPDTHTCTITRRFGGVGDASFNQKRWNGYPQHRQKLESIRRLDYAAYRLAFRSALDAQPFDRARTAADVQTLVDSANTLMGFAPSPVGISLLDSQSILTTAATPGLNLGDLFGADAQVLPGISFADLFRDIAMRDGSDIGISSLAGEPGAEPLQWNFTVTGIDWLLPLIGNKPGQISMTDLMSLARNQGQSLETSKPLEFGVEASLQWSNHNFKEVPLGPVKFIPMKNDPSVEDTRLEIGAKATMSLGLGGLPANLSELKIDPGKAQISSRAELKNFNILVFEVINVKFSSVAFTMSSDGRKEFSTKVRDVELTGLLEFVNQLSKVLGKSGNESGIDLDISLSRVRIKQTLKFPTNNQPLFIGTAQIINLAFSWGVMIPLTGRDVLSVSFGLSSREKPLTIFVPPWYGGKAHVLMEVTTRGLRMLEISMEYGALVPITWGVANGEASLTAGVFYMIELDSNNNGSVVFKAFVRAAAHLDIAGIIHFGGEILIALSYQKQNGRKFIVGEARQTVSVKLGFIRYSFTFAATHKEEVQESRQLASRGPQYFIGDSAHHVERRPSQQRLSQFDSCPDAIPAGEYKDVEVFANLTEGRRKLFEQIVDGYLD
jgi:hypothetical protein